MIKRTVFIVFCCLVLCNSQIAACDSCGSSASNIGIGLLTNYRSNFIRLSYFDTRFKVNSDHEYATSDRFAQLDLALRYTLGKSKRIRLMARFPYSVNTRKNEAEQLVEQGLSDIRFIANYAILNSLPIGKNSMLYLEAGGGLSLPTGKHDEQIHERNLPENFNVGRGALGYVFQMNTVLNVQKAGLVWSNNYQMNSATPKGYRYGTQFNTQVTVFREFQLKKMQWIPNLGLNFESTSKDNYANGKEVLETGGNGLFASAAFNIKTEKGLAGISYAIPLSEDYSAGAVNAKGRLACHFSYLF